MSDPAAHAQPERRIYRVGELLTGLRRLLDDRVGRLWVVGEVSNYHAARSGHFYFTLKDESGQIRAALFRNTARRIPFDVEEGLEVVVHADVTVYEARGDLQLIVQHVEPRGQGALQLAFEQLRRRLEAEGLFDAARKRPLPAHPRRVAVVTSPTGAAVRDVIRACVGRFPATRILVVPTRVQGEGSENEIAAALAAAGRSEADVVLLVRGGGSLEDLWSFNSEVVARAIAGCPVPVVSGVGHEVDVTIADFVADARASTPTAAAALALPDRRVFEAQLARDDRRLARAIGAVLDAARARLDQSRGALRMLAPSARLAAQRARLSRLHGELVRGGSRLAERRRSRFAGLVGRLDSLSPLAVLGRGYAIVRRAADGEIVRSAAAVAPGDRLRVRLAQGELEALTESASSSDEPEKPF